MAASIPRFLRWPASVLALALVCAAPLAAQTRDGAPIDPRSRWAERLLTLPGGVVLRAQARLLDGRWQRRERDDHRAVDVLPAGAVLAERSLADALDELAERRRAARTAEAGERVPLVDWMLEVGLYTEALGELDRAFAEDPDCAEALALLARPDLPIGLPAHDLADDASLAALVDYGARSPVSLQERVLIALARAPLASQRSLLPRLEQGLLDAQPVRRLFCARALRRLFPGSELKALTRRAVLDTSEGVRQQSALALADSGEDSVIAPLALALDSESALVRTHAAEALERVGLVAAVEPLALRLATLGPGSGRGSGGGGGSRPRGTLFVGRQTSYVQGFDAEIATNASIANPIIGVAQEGVTLDARVFGVSGPSGYSYARETASLRRALARLTGAPVRDTNAAWKAWWREQGEAWLQERLGAPARLTTVAEG